MCVLTYVVTCVCEWYMLLFSIYTKLVNALCSCEDTVIYNGDSELVMSSTPLCKMFYDNYFIFLMYVVLYYQ